MTFKLLSLSKNTNQHVHVNFIITLSLGSMKTGNVITLVKPCYNDVIYNGHIAKIIILGAMTLLCYIEIRSIVKNVVLRWNCSVKEEG